MKKKTILIIAGVVSLVLFMVFGGIIGYRLITGGTGQEQEEDGNDKPVFSDKTMFSLRIYQPWIYESLHYTLLTDGTLIVQYYDTELGREQLSEERMDAIRRVFSPEKVYYMDIGKENDRTDGTRVYIVLYDSDENEIQIGGYELEGGQHFDSYFNKLYTLLEDDYTKQWSDKLMECRQEGVTYREKYLDGTD